MTKDKDLVIRQELGNNLRKDCAYHIWGKRMLTYV
jgi:hypothetical protein